MWTVQNVNIQMVEGDYGIILPVTITGMNLKAGDTLKFTFLTNTNGEVVLEKEFNNVVDNTIELEFSNVESALFAVKTYVYRLDWFKNGEFMCSLIPRALFKVVDKA